MGNFLRRRLITPLVALLKQGITPEKLALSLAFGLVLGTFPVLGSTTLLCAAAAFMFGLNLPAIQLVNYFIYPLQLVLIIPFMHMGERLTGAIPSRLSLSEMVALGKGDMAHAAGQLWGFASHAIFAWMILAPAMGFVLYHIFVRAIRHTQAIYPRRESAG
jgi:uncharacterized protein (DUF2062 family)